MTIRPATQNDFPALFAIYSAARAFMARNGNPTQWSPDYPSRWILQRDMDMGALFVGETKGILHCAFACIPGEEPSYARIQEGNWLNDRPYATIHRVASDGTLPGVFALCIAFCAARFPNLRIDTHRNNAVMQHLILKHGFTYCGVITVEDGSERLAYQRCLD